MGGSGVSVGGPMRPLCFIFLESSLKTADTWYRIPLKWEGGGCSASEHHTVTNTHTHTQGILQLNAHTGEEGSV